MTARLKQQFDSRHFPNDYQLVNGIAMHAENPESFHIPPDVIKRHISPGQFVELRANPAALPSSIAGAPAKPECSIPRLG